MRMESENNGKKQENVHVHYVNVPKPSAVEENFAGYFHDHDLALAEQLQNQEFQRIFHGDTSRDSSSTGSRPNSGHGESTGERNSSRTARFESQLALDEAFARELQEIENQLADTSLGEIAKAEASIKSSPSKFKPFSDITPAQSSAVNAKHNSASTSSQAAREDDIDPDFMSYEELQRLGEAIGTENKGLSDELISFLPTSTYKIGLFSKRDKHEECVICCTTYKNRDELMTLPCQHQYHKDCITTWLKINKACPVCNDEVFGS